jgi:hypothetical protein
MPDIMPAQKQGACDSEEATPKQMPSPTARSKAQIFALYEERCPSESRLTDD